MFVLLETGCRVSTLPTYYMLTENSSNSGHGAGIGHIPSIQKK